MTRSTRDKAVLPKRRCWCMVCLPLLFEMQAIPVTIGGSSLTGLAPAPVPLRVPYTLWSDPIKAGKCNAGVVGPGGVKCELILHPDASEDVKVKSYHFPAGIFEVDEQLLLPPYTSITGAGSPNDVSDPTKSPVNMGQFQTLFLATRGVSSYNKTFCFAKEMVHTRVGFVLSSYCTVRNQLPRSRHDSTR